MSLIRTLFLPHYTNNHKAHLIKSSALFLLSVVFVSLQIFINFFLLAKPAVLGFSSNITAEGIINLTNAEREKAGLPRLKENKLLSEAAKQKAAEMFAFDYWAHVSPSGRSPWAFFSDAGYQYQYAGENLARDFSDPGAVVRAWMNSPSHKENILNPKYQDIGVAVVEGSLGGVETALVVQHFGTPFGAAVKTKEIVLPEEKTVVQSPALANQPETVSKESLTKGIEKEISVPLTNPLDLTKAIVIFIIGVLCGVFALDIFLVSRQKTPRFSSRSFAQLLFLLFVIVASILVREGAIL